MYVLDGAVQTDSEMHCAEESGFYHRTDSGTAEPNRASLLTPPSTQTREQYRPNRVQIALVILSSAKYRVLVASEGGGDLEPKSTCLACIQYPAVARDLMLR